ncbi:hypothetical protein ISN45_Aa03g032470 [Arabidopsis thaliana x Arabidopsis arenosa]|uniref:Transmembrane protein n=1 Tax=Arabidopsis thaliana x Arabidopsis arenosa TaxID=1240361 RepID=A0A8T2B257_9BRAS|nr:hypothetical protein ISN45_Aa03g032470 [Arabidopsis thaliana x Arabidopsis arenosa]
MATVKAILQFSFLLPLLRAVLISGDVGIVFHPHPLEVIPITRPTSRCDVDLLAIPPIAEPYTVVSFILISSPISIGADDGPIQSPPDVVSQGVSHNRFFLRERSMVLRRQNLRSCGGAMARLWGQGDLGHGRIIEGRFQVVIPSEEFMAMVIRRGPRAFAERMVVLQRWGLSLKQRPPRKPPWNQHITADIGDATRMRIRRSNQQHILTFESVKDGSSIKRRCFPS